MSQSILEIARLLVDDPDYVRTLTEQLESRAVEPTAVEQLIAYARSRQATMGQAMARKVLTAAGISWEAL